VRIALVLLLVCCNQTVPRKPQAVVYSPCADGWLLLRAVQQCSDMRSGWSGYWVLEVADGPHAGRHVIVSYGEGQKSGTIGNWNLSKTVTFGMTPKPSSMPNSCSVLALDATVTMPYDGGVDVSEGFEREAEAREALAARC
jgi:hypothetical protein